MERGGCSLLHNDVQSPWAHGFAGWNPGLRQTQEGALQSVAVLRAGLQGARSLPSHGHPGLLWMHQDTPIRRREMWKQTHRGGRGCELERIL